MKTMIIAAAVLAATLASGASAANHLIPMLCVRGISGGDMGVAVTELQCYAVGARSTDRSTCRQVAASELAFAEKNHLRNTGLVAFCAGTDINEATGKIETVR